MGTRGAMGFVLDGQDFITYNHFDSYPDGLGCDVLEAIKKASGKIGLDEIKKNIKSLKMIEDSELKPSDEDIQNYSDYANLAVGAQGIGNKEIHTWYQLLRRAQGKIYLYMDGTISHMISSNNFIKDSLFCEYAYLINLDTDKFEYYVGFQKEPDIKNRYGQEDDRGYYPCKLVHEFDLSDLPSKSDFLGTLYPEEEDED